MKKRILSLWLVTVLCLSLLPSKTFAAKTEENPVSRRSILWGADSPLGYHAETGEYDKLYFGTYLAEGQTEGEPYAWRILDGETNHGEDGLFLLSMPVYEGVRFTLPFQEQENWYAAPHNVWTSPGCSAREWCRTLAESTEVFSDIERSALLATDQEDAAYNSKNSFFNSYYGRVRTGALDGDKVFYISAQEFEDDRYGLNSDTDYTSARYALRSTVDESYAVDDVTIHDGTIAVSLNGRDGSGISTVRIYHKEFSGYTFPRELSDTEKFFIGSGSSFGFFGNFLPTGAEEAYTYQYNAVTARPAMNLDAQKILYITAADNSGHVEYGAVSDDAEHLEWKTVLCNGDTDFRQRISLTDMPQNNLFGKDGGTVTIAHPAFNSLDEYTAITASLTDRDGNILCYGAIGDDAAATVSTVEIPSGLADGVYTLRVTAEQQNDEKITDLAAEPFVAEIKVANEHSHPVCGKAECAEHEDVDWEPITTAEELAAMEVDGYYYLIGDVAAPETACVGHLCTNQFAVTGTLKAGVATDDEGVTIPGLTLCDCRGKTSISSVAVADNAILNQYGKTVEDLTTGTNSTLNIYGGSQDASGVSHGTAVMGQMGEGTKLNIGKGGYVTKAGDMTPIELPKNCEIDLFDGGGIFIISTPYANTKVTVHKNSYVNSIALLSADSILTVEDGGSVYDVIQAVEGSTINLYRCSSDSIVSSGDVNLYGAVKGCVFQVEKPINICAPLREKQSEVSTIDIKKADGTLKWQSGVFTNGWNTHMADATYSDYFKTVSGYTIGKDENGELRCEKKGHDAGSHPICGMACTHDGAHQNADWTEIKTWSEFGAEGGQTLTGGNYCLTANIDPINYGGIAVEGDVRICLNGYRLALRGGCIEVKRGSLTICDCVGTGQISGGSGVTVKYRYEYGVAQEVNDFGGAVYLSSGTSLNLYGGKITNSMAHFGGAVYVPAGATFTMYGGELSGNTAGGARSSYYIGLYDQRTGICYSKGGAVYLDGGTFVMNGGKIANNVSSTRNTTANGLNDGGGAVYISGGLLSSGSGQFIMNGGTISGNSTKRYDTDVSWDLGGCGVRVYNGTFTMNNGTINQCDPIQVDASGTFNLVKGDVIGGTCTNCRNTVTGTPTGSYEERYRCASVWQTGGTVNMSGGTISGYESLKLFGGNFYLRGGNVKGSRSPVTIQGGTLQMSNGTIGTKGAREDVWGVNLTSGAFHISGGEVAGFIGGVRVENGATMGVSGTAKITDNGTTEYGFQIPQNVYLKNGAKMNVSTMNNGAKVGVTMESATGIFTNGGSGYAGYFESDNPSYTVGAVGSNLQLGGTPVSLKSILGGGKALEADPKAPTVDLWITLKVGETVQLVPQMEPSNAEYTWNDNNNRYVSLDTKTGALTGLRTCTNSWIELVYDHGR